MYLIMIVLTDVIGRRWRLDQLQEPVTVAIGQDRYGIFGKRRQFVGGFTDFANPDLRRAKHLDNHCRLSENRRQGYPRLSVGGLHLLTGDDISQNSIVSDNGF